MPPFAPISLSVALGTSVAGLGQPSSLPPLAAAEQWISIALVGAGVVLLLAVLLRQMQRPAAADDRAAQPGPAQPLSPLDRLEAIRRDAEQRASARALATEIEDLSRRLAAELDAKAARLEALVLRADERIRTLDALAGTPASPHPHAGRHTDPSPPLDPERHAHDDPARQEIIRLADEGLPPVEIARRLREHPGKVELILALRRR